MARRKNSSNARDSAKQTTPQTEPASQIVEGSIIRGSVDQSSTEPGTRQRFSFSSGGALRQRIATKLPEFSGFGVKASGIAAVVVAAIVIVVWLALKYLR